jgi:hypothetical protein
MREALLRLSPWHWGFVLLAIWFLVWFLFFRRRGVVSRRQVDPYGLLLGAVLGDRAKADRLIQYELQRGSSSRDIAIARAFDRLKSDRGR